MKNNIFIAFFFYNLFCTSLKASLSNEDKVFLGDRISKIQYEIYLDRIDQAKAALALLNLGADSSWQDVQSSYKTIHTKENENRKEDPFFIDKAYLFLRDFFSKNASAKELLQK